MSALLLCCLGALACQVTVWTHATMEDPKDMHCRASALAPHNILLRSDAAHMQQPSADYHYTCTHAQHSSMRDVLASIPGVDAFNALPNTSSCILLLWLITLTAMRTSACS